MVSTEAGITVTRTNCYGELFSSEDKGLFLLQETSVADLGLHGTALSPSNAKPFKPELTKDQCSNSTVLRSYKHHATSGFSHVVHPTGWRALPFAHGRVSRQAAKHRKG